MSNENKKNGNGKVEIHGREYMTVALRVQLFRKTHPVSAGWGIETELISNDEKAVLFKAKIIAPDGRCVGTGHSMERWGSSTINKTSALENCETSAIGRALASAGFGGSEFASADELAGKLTRADADRVVETTFANTPATPRVWTDSTTGLPLHEDGTVGGSLVNSIPNTPAPGAYAKRPRKPGNGNGRNRLQEIAATVPPAPAPVDDVPVTEILKDNGNGELKKALGRMWENLRATFAEGGETTKAMAGNFQHCFIAAVIGRSPELRESGELKYGVGNLTADECRRVADAVDGPDSKAAMKRAREIYKAFFPPDNGGCSDEPESVTEPADEREIVPDGEFAAKAQAASVETEEPPF